MPYFTVTKTAEKHTLWGGTYLYITLKGTSPSPIRTKPFSFLRTYYLLRLELLQLLAFVKLFKALLFYFRVILNNNRNNKVRELDAFARTIR